MTLQALLGITLPIVQAPMAGVQGSALALAVCHAGGLGSLPCAMLGPGQLQQELAALQAGTVRPFNLNFFCHQPPTPDEQAELQWRELLAPYFQELGLDPAQRSPAASRAPFSAETAALLAPHRPPVLSFHFGLPEPALLAQVKSWGTKVLASATTVAEGLWLQERGADVVIAQGLEAGGHRGHFLSDDLSEQMGTLALVPQMVAALRLPVIAAGGITHAAGVAAAMALGAAGVQVGTAYLLCPEATTSDVHRAALASRAAQHTALTRLYTGRPARGIVNRLMRELGAMNPAAPAFPLAASALAALRAQAEAMGSGDFSPLWAGQNTRGCQPLPAAQITAGLAAGLPGHD